MAGHTPGPWTASRATIRNMVAEISAKRGEATYTIAHVDCVDGGDQDARNVALIAAAPELLEAARLALNLLEQHWPTLANMAPHEVDLLSAAIAKAEVK